MAVKLGVIMDPIDQINPKKDTTLGLLHAAEQRGWQLHYMEMKDMRLRDGLTLADSMPLSVHLYLENWFEFFV